MDPLNQGSPLAGSHEVSTDDPSSTGWNAADVADFRHWLNQEPATAASPPTALMRESLVAWIGEEFEDTKERKARFDRALQRAGRTGDPVAGMEVSQRLSELYVNHDLTVKVIAKTTQAIDTLSRLQ